MSTPIKSGYHLIGRASVNLTGSILQGILALALIPMATFVLGPEDYGVFGMAVVVVGAVMTSRPEPV